MIRESKRGPVLDQEPPGKDPIVTRRMDADHQMFQCHEHGCKDSGSLLCGTARQSGHQEFLIQDVVQLTVSETVLWRHFGHGLQEHHRVMGTFEGASVARLLETHLQVLCELTEGSGVGELVPQGQPGEETLDPSDRTPSTSCELVAWLSCQELTTGSS